MERKRQDAEKARFWRKAMREAARSGVSVREFCRQRKLRECQFYWWQRRLSVTGQATEEQSRRAASFALVSDDNAMLEAGIELLLANGRRLRIGRGVDEATLRAVLAAVDPAGC